MPHANATLVQQLYDAFSKGDLATMQKHLAPDLVMHVPGRNPVAGEYQGQDGFLAFMAKNAELAGPTLKVELEGVLADDERAVTFEHLTARRDGKTLDVRDSTIFRFRDGKIAEMTLMSSDPYAHDRFWS